MTTYSVAEAKNNLSELIDRVLGGEGVVITRHGTPVVKVTAVTPAPRPVTEEDLARLDALCYRPAKPPSEDAATLVSRLRDEDGH
jgi:prevent-host-death family protein